MIAQSHIRAHIIKENQRALVPFITTHACIKIIQHPFINEPLTSNEAIIFVSTVMCNDVYVASYCVRDRHVTCVTDRWSLANSSQHLSLQSITRVNKKQCYVSKALR